MFRRGRQLVDADAGFVGAGSRPACMMPRVGPERVAGSALRRDPLFDNVDRVENDYYRFRNLAGG